MTLLHLHQLSQHLPFPGCRPGGQGFRVLAGKGKRKAREKTLIPFKGLQQEAEKPETDFLYFVLSLHMVGANEVKNTR